MNAEVQTEWITSLERFAAVRGEWNRLVRSDGDVPFLAHEWLTAWWEAFGRGTPEICTRWRAEEIVAALPLSRRRGALHAWAGTESSPAFHPLARNPEDLSALIEEVTRADWTTLSLRALPVVHPATPMLFERLGESCRFTFDRAEYVPIIETTGTLADYRTTMSQNTRVRVDKRRRRMERQHEVRVETVREPEDVPREVAEALQLEMAGWKGRAGSATLCVTNKRVFTAGLVEAFARRGELRLSRLWLDGRLTAFDLAIEHDNRVYSLITSYDEAAAGFSPGLVLRMAMVEHCFAHGLRSNELLGSLLDWKQKFFTSTRDTRVFVAYRRRSPRAMSALLLRRRVIPYAKPLRERWRAFRTSRR